MRKIVGCALVALFLASGFSAESTAQTPTKADLPRFMNDLKSEDAKARASACEGLYKLGGIKTSLIKEAISPLMKMIKDDKDAKVRAAAAKALGAADPAGDDGIALLIEVVKNEKEETPVRVGACQGLGQIGPRAKEALPAVKMFMDDNKGDKKIGKNLKGVIKQLSAK
jgi:hypothetical protein